MNPTHHQPTVPAPAAPTRRTLLLGAGIAGSALLAACAGPGPGAGASPGSRPAADLKGITVEYWSMQTPTHPEEVARVKVLNNFTAENTLGIKVETAATAGQTAATLDKVIGALAAGTPPDLVNTFNFYLADLANRNALADVDAELKSNADWKKVRPSIYPHIVQGLSWRGKFHAVPSHNSYFMLYFNAAALKRAGLAAPARTWTWDQFVDYGKKASQPPDVTAYDCDWTYPHTGMLALNNGARFVSPDNTRFTLNTSEVREAVEWQLGLVKAGLMRAHDGNKGGYKERLPEGKVVFQFGVPARVPVYRRDAVEFGTTHYPLGPKNRAKQNFTHGTAYGYAAFKGKDPQKVQASLLASLWASRPDSGMIFAQEGGVPPSYRHIVESAEFKARWQKDPEVWPFYEALPSFLPYPSVPVFWDARSEINGEFVAIWAGKKSITDALNEAQRKAQQLLDQALKGA
ncbi:MAG: extracellular solute-binding protein [Chloroflexi bacterium]|nr:extracellular solute-binding protein [Chloroflexota bacterium]